MLKPTSMLSFKQGVSPSVADLCKSCKTLQWAVRFKQGVSPSVADPKNEQERFLLATEFQTGREPQCG